MQNLDEAYRMLDAFASVGARSFDVTFLDIDGAKRGFRKDQTVAQLRNSLPKLFPGLTERRNSLVIRPHAEGVALVQLDDLDAAALERVKPISFLTVCTSSGNHQAWVAVTTDSVSSQARHTTGCAKDFARRLRKGVGADISASGAVRMAGTVNFKRKYEPEFPTVSIESVTPGRIVTPEQLEEMGLLAPPETMKVTSIPPRVSETQNTRRWPSYEISLMRAKKRKDGMPDRSDADFKWCLTALTGGKTVEDTKAKLLEVSERAQERRDRDPGYVRVTVENAAKCVEQNYGKARSRA